MERFLPSDFTILQFPNGNTTLYGTVQSETEFLLFLELAVPQFSVATNENGPNNSETVNSSFGGLKGKVQYFLLSDS